MHLTMQTFIAQIFAATTTVLVVTFPAPSDLWKALFPDQQQMSDRSQTEMLITDFRDTDLIWPEVVNLTEMIIGPSTNYLPMLSDCSFYLSRSSTVDTTPCRELVEMVSAEYPEIDLMIDGESLNPLSESLFLAKAEICRIEWGRGDLTDTASGQSCLN